MSSNFADRHVTRAQACWIGFAGGVAITFIIITIFFLLTK